MAPALKIDKSQIHLAIIHGSEGKKRSRIKGRWPGSGQAVSYQFPQGAMKMSFVKDILSASFQAEEDLFLREIRMTIRFHKPRGKKIRYNGDFPGCPGIGISDSDSLIRLKRNRRMRQYIRFIPRRRSLVIVWEFNCFIPESESHALDPLLMTQKSSGLHPGPKKKEHRLPSDSPETMWIAPQESRRGIRVKDLEENLSWMEKERFFFDIIRLGNIHTRAGDWENLHTDYRGKIGFINRRIEHNGMIPSLAFEPFYADCDSDLVRRHPEWLVSSLKGEPLTFAVNRQRKVYILDFTQPEVQEYLEESVNIFRKQWGFRSFHLIGLTVLLLPGRHGDNSVESGKILYSALDFFRRVLGKDCFITAEGLPLISELKHINMITLPSRITTKRKSKREIPGILYRFLGISALSNYPWILNAGSYPLPRGEGDYHKQAGESFRQMLLISGGILSFCTSLTELTDDQKREIAGLIPSFRKFSRGEVQLLEPPRRDETAILFNSSGYLAVFNLSTRKQKLTLNMEALREEIYNRTGESPIREGRTGMNTGELELLIPPLGSRIFKF